MTSWLGDKISSQFVNKKDKVWINGDKIEICIFLNSLQNSCP